MAVRGGPGVGRRMSRFARQRRLTAYEWLLVHGTRRLVHVIVACVLVLLSLPLVVIVPVSLSASSFLSFPPTALSLRWYRQYASRRDWTEPTIVSFTVAGLTAVVATSIGMLASFGLARGGFRGKRVVQALILSPMIVPVIISAVALYFVLAQWRLVGTQTGLVLAHTVLALPRVILVLTAVLRGFDRSLERAAMSLGASPMVTFALVTLPIIRPGVLAAALLAFLTSFDEVIVAIFLSGTTSVTLPRRMWDGILLEYDPTMAAVASLLITFSVIVIVALAVLRPQEAGEPQVRA